MSDPVDPQNVFDAYYYQHGCGAPYVRNEAWLAFFQGIADRIIEDIQPKTVLDAGCALGFLVEGFRNQGVEAWGVDISEYAIASVHESIRPFCRVGSVIEPFERKYDLIVTIEVAEHMQPLLSKQMIANLCAHTDDVIFTSTPFDYKETTHFNVQPPEVWSREFARHGFFRDVDYDASFITAWAVRYRRKEQPVHQMVYDYERRFWLLNKENTDLRQLSNELRSQMRQESDVLQREITRLCSEAAEKNLQLQSALEEMQRVNEALTLSEQRVNELQQRWDALEQSRTWKILTTLYRLRKPGVKES
jgi:SAM-dependent methyltransferase